VELGGNVQARHYGQHQREELDPRRTVLEELEEVATPGERAQLRKLLGCFLFSGDDVDKPVGVLSGGEKARLSLARMLVRPANLLLLDEPTNHLDLASREVLEEALNEYDGTLVVVSHDRYLINRIATSVAGIADGRIETRAGDYDEYAAHRAAPAPAGAGDLASERSERERRVEARRREAAERNRRYRERREAERRLGPLEAEIADLERRLAEKRAQQAEPSLWSDPGRAAEVARATADLERALEQAYARWESAASES
jgi:ATP-binding cassette subfamily F protein 3